MNGIAEDFDAKNFSASVLWSIFILWVTSFGTELEGLRSSLFLWLCYIPLAGISWLFIFYWQRRKYVETQGREAYRLYIQDVFYMIFVGGLASGISALFISLGTLVLLGGLGLF